MNTQIKNFINGPEFGMVFSIPYDIVSGNLINYKSESLKNSKGIYFIHSEELGVSYIGMTNSGASNRFERHIGRSEGKTYGTPSKTWDYFYEWCQHTQYSYRHSSKYLFVKFYGDVSVDHLEWLEGVAIHKFQPLINDKSFQLFGHAKLEKLKSIPTDEGTTKLFTFE